jgi:hypothetical protein
MILVVLSQNRRIKEPNSAVEKTAKMIPTMLRNNICLELLTIFLESILGKEKFAKLENHQSSKKHY